MMLESASDPAIFGSMKTTVDIPDEALSELMQLTKVDTKRAAIVQAVEDFNRRRRMAELAKHAGTFKDFMSPDDLKRLRQDQRNHDRH